MEITHKDAKKVEAIAKAVEDILENLQDHPAIAKRLTRTIKHIHNTAVLIQNGDQRKARLAKKKERLLARKSKLAAQLAMLEAKEEEETSEEENE